MVHLLFQMKVPLLTHVLAIVPLQEVPEELEVLQVEDPPEAVPLEVVPQVVDPLAEDTRDRTLLWLANIIITEISTVVMPELLLEQMTLPSAS